MKNKFEGLSERIASRSAKLSAIVPSDMEITDLIDSHMDLVSAAHASAHASGHLSVGNQNVTLGN